MRGGYSTSPPLDWSSSPGDTAPALGVGSKKQEGKPESAPQCPQSLPVSLFPSLPPLPPVQEMAESKDAPKKLLGCQDATPQNASIYFVTLGQKPPMLQPYRTMFSPASVCVLQGPNVPGEKELLYCPFYA